MTSFLGPFFPSARALASRPASGPTRTLGFPSAVCLPAGSVAHCPPPRASRFHQQFPSSSRCVCLAPTRRRPAHRRTARFSAPRSAFRRTFGARRPTAVRRHPSVQCTPALGRFGFAPGHPTDKRRFFWLSRSPTLFRTPTTGPKVSFRLFC